GGRDHDRVPEMGGNEGDWIEVRPRRRKASRQLDDGFDRLRQRGRSRSRTISPL
ncbi:hypothetical protein A2U01_0007456, partial [Trifolium medium]|nr:hypothetical protein [Trifolium medium]